MVYSVSSGSSRIKPMLPVNVNHAEHIHSDFVWIPEGHGFVHQPTGSNIMWEWFNGLSLPASVRSFPKNGGGVPTPVIDFPWAFSHGNKPSSVFGVTPMTMETSIYSFLTMANQAPQPHLSAVSLAGLPLAPFAAGGGPKKDTPTAHRVL